jgi:hypothetical protein
MNRRDAALHLVRRYPGGIDALAQRMGKRPDTLRKELTGAEGYKWGVDDEELAIDLCIAAGVRAPLDPLTAAVVNRGGLVIDLPQIGQGDAESFKRIADTAREFSEFVAATAQAEADGSVTANELRQVEKEAGELVASLQRCLAHMRQQHEAAKPAALRAVGGS